MWTLAPAIVAGLLFAVAITSSPVGAQEGPTVVDPNLRVSTVVGGLVTPSSMAFLGQNDFLIAEKNTGMVKRVVNGVVQSTVLDLSVNNASERGLLGLALHPRFPANPSVYLFWSCRSNAPLDGDPFQPEDQVCSDAAMSGPRDTDNILLAPLRGNRVDRFEWTGSALVTGRTCSCCARSSTTGRPTHRARATLLSLRGETTMEE